MTVPRYTVTCTRNERVAEGVHELRFQKPERFTFRPGQFVLLEVPLVDAPQDIQTRAFSIASILSESELIFAMKLKPGGRASRWITEILTSGTTVTMMGPFGFFFVNCETKREYLFIATSTGIAPFRSQIHLLLSEGEHRRVDLVFGAREEEDLFWIEEFKNLTKRHENFFLHLALSQPSPAWKGHRGRVQTLVPLIAKNLLEKDVYICGNPDMTGEVKTLCLSEWGIPKENVHVEAYL